MHELLTKAIQAGVRFRLEGDALRVTAPDGALDDDMRQALRAQKAHIITLLQAGEFLGGESANAALTHDEAHADAPFPLTDLQHAYWVGRDASVEMGGVATHLYVELDCASLDLERLNVALTLLIDRQPMLRAVVGGDGQQRILRQVPAYRIAVDDRSGAAQAEVVKAIEAVRSELSHQVLAPERWPLFDIRATRLPGQRLRLHVSLDLLIFDAGSLHIFFREWHQLYRDLFCPLPALGIDFRDYVLAERRLQEGPRYRRAFDYWMAQVDALPAAPALPLRADPGARLAPRFVRRQARLERARWERLKAEARARDITPSCLLLAVYAEVLARWSSSPRFTINVTLSRRRPLHPDVPAMIGNFTSPVLHAVDRSDAALRFADFARHLQEHLLTDLDHAELSGVVVLREWSRRQGGALQAAMPVVFSSGLAGAGEQEIGDLEQFGTKVHGISQTSQVWLDHHVAEVRGDLLFNWDVVDAVFEHDVPDAMFSAYCRAIERLSEQPSLWDACNIVALPAPMQLRRERADQTAGALPNQRLHAGFVAAALATPQAVAIASDERVMHYAELLAESVALAERLLQSGVAPGEPVAVVMRKGWAQIVAVCGALLAGAAYLPVDAGLPPQRKQELLRAAAVRRVLTEPDCLEPELSGAALTIFDVLPGAHGEFGPAHRQSLEGGLDQLAYVIFTSGTSGVPKGVMIDHRGAANTILHVNRMWQVGAQDRVLALSSLNFDLSVYDIFGLLGVGGTLVIPDWRKGHDPAHWQDLMARHGVTLWNSAPQLMHLLMDAADAHSGTRGGSHDNGQSGATAVLRTVLLSGDFIPVELPDRVRQRFPRAQVISLGGATEASIWSVFYPTRELDPAATSIPYGMALPNQTMRVLDAALRPCPDHVTGQIHIGGIGLAIGYLGDPEKTADRFITHPDSGERLYRTGDLGRYAADGKLLILGRADRQLKIRGYRVEPGEIEAVLARHPQVRQAHVTVTPPGASRQLVAYVEAPGAVTAQQLRAHLAQHLPEYMLPSHLIRLDVMPVSANGKIDHRALPPPALADTGPESMLAPRNEEERIIRDAWAGVMPAAAIGVTDNFFELGGDSILATQLVHALNAVLPHFRLEMHELFENLTVEMLAALYRQRVSTSATIGSTEIPASTGAESAADSAVCNVRMLMQDLDAAREEIAVLDFSVAHKPLQAPRTILLTGASGWIGTHLLATLLVQTDVRVICLLRSGEGLRDDIAGNQEGADGSARLWAALRRHDLVLDPAWRVRVEFVGGNLAQPNLGLTPAMWQHLAETVDAVYHAGASLNVLADYPMHRQTNATSMGAIVRLALAHHVKPVWFCSPMAVCRRESGKGEGGDVVVLHEEATHPDPQGIPGGYAQSKWVAEQILLEAAARGLPARIYRSTHALPAARSGVLKQGDTYSTVLQAACAAGVIPEWDASAVNGVPVDLLAQLIVEDSLAGIDNAVDPTCASGTIVHLENHHPPSLKALLGLLLADRAVRPACVPRQEWKRRCIDVARHLPAQQAALVQVLFGERSGAAPVDHMFDAHPSDTGGFEQRGLASKLDHLTPPDYWRMVQRMAGW